MTETPETDKSIADEFRNLGMNLISTMRVAWDSPERRKIQSEVEEGLSALAATIKMEAGTFTGSPTGQRLKADLDDWHERVRTGEAETRARQEIIKAIHIINTELEKVATRWNSQGDDDPPAGV